MRDTPNPATGKSLESLVNLVDLEDRILGVLEVQGYRGVAFHNFLVSLGVQEDKLGSRQVSSQVDRMHPMGKEGKECLDTQKGMEILDSTEDKELRDIQMGSSFLDSTEDME